MPSRRARAVCFCAEYAEAERDVFDVLVVFVKLELFQSERRCVSKHMVCRFAGKAPYEVMGLESELQKGSFPRHGVAGNSLFLKAVCRSASGLCRSGTEQALHYEDADGTENDSGDQSDQISGLEDLQGQRHLPGAVCYGCDGLP